MVICPWCGTNYDSFQSNCSKCGGPIQADHTVLPTAQEGNILMPPPPPRDISDNYLWKLLFADAWSMSAGIFTLIGGIFSIVGFFLTVAIFTAFVGIPFLLMGLLFLGGGGYVLYWRYKVASKSLDILRNGEAVAGQITSTQTNFSVQVNGRNPLTIGYQFSLNGMEYQNTITTLNHLERSFEPGKKICVIFLPNEPQFNSLYPHP